MLYLWNGKLLVGANGLATDVNCCCEEPPACGCGDLPTTLYADVDNETSCDECFGTKTVTLTESGACSIPGARCWYGKLESACGEFADLEVWYECDADDCKHYVKATCGGASCGFVETTGTFSPLTTDRIVCAIAGSGCCGGSVPASIGITVRE